MLRSPVPAGTLLTRHEDGKKFLVLSEDVRHSIVGAMQRCWWPKFSGEGYGIHWINVQAVASHITPPVTCKVPGREV